MCLSRLLLVVTAGPQFPRYVCVPASVSVPVSASVSVSVSVPVSASASASVPVSVSASVYRMDAPCVSLFRPSFVSFPFPPSVGKDACV